MLLEPSTTLLLGKYLRPWLLELLPWAQEILLNQENPETKTTPTDAHRLMSVALSKLLIINSDVKK